MLTRQDFPRPPRDPQKSQWNRAFFAGTGTALLWPNGPERIRGQWI